MSSHERIYSYGRRSSRQRQTRISEGPSATTSWFKRVVCLFTPDSPDGLADWTEGRGNAGKTASSFFHPSGPSEFGYLIQRKSLILQSKLARGVSRTPFHPVNPG